MTQADLDRIAELEEMKELGEELDEDERDELKDLRSSLRYEKKHNEAMVAWDKAKEVYRLSFPGAADQEPAYALTTKPFEVMAAVHKWAKADYVVEKVVRPDFAAVGYDSSQQIYGE